MSFSHMFFAMNRLTVSRNICNVSIASANRVGRAFTTARRNRKSRPEHRRSNRMARLRSPTNEKINTRYLEGELHPYVIELKAAIYSGREQYFKDLHFDQVLIGDGRYDNMEHANVLWKLYQNIKSVEGLLQEVNVGHLDTLARILERVSKERAICLLEDLLDSDIRLMQSSYSLLIQLYCEADDYEKAIHVSELLKKRDYIPSDKDFNVLIRLLATNGDIQGAVDRLIEMRTRGQRADIYAYGALINNLLLRKLYREAAQLCLSIINEGLMPNQLSLTNSFTKNLANFDAPYLHVVENVSSFLIWIYLEESRVDLATKVYFTHLSGSSSPVVHALLKSLVDACLNVSDVNRILALLECATEDKTMSLYSDALSQCIKEGWTTGAEEIFERANKRGVLFSKKLLGQYTALFSRLRRPADALRVYNIAKSQGVYGEFKPYVFNALARCLVKDRLTADARQVLADMEAIGLEPSLTTFHIYFMIATEELNVEDCKNTLKRLYAANLQPNHLTLRHLFNFWVQQGDKEKIKEIYQYICEHGHEIDVVDYNIRMKLFSIDNVQTLFKEMQDARIQPNDVTSRTLLKMSLEAGHLNNARQIYNFLADGGMHSRTLAIMTSHMINTEGIKKACDFFFNQCNKYNIIPTISEFNMLLDGAYKAKNANLMGKVYKKMTKYRLRLQNPSLFAGLIYLKAINGHFSEAKNYLKEMQKREMKELVKGYTALIGGCVVRRDYKKAEWLFRSMQVESGVKPDVRAYAWIIGAHMRQKMPEKALERYRAMLKDGYTADDLVPFKKRVYFDRLKLLVANNDDLVKYGNLEKNR
ncbi:543_t:CDS:1 [Paraglomus occultum]|uniref:543_t:CDS:1 n=1 Tax=Paraglomus occultum TaxID=144539 RepID=A0A9N8ZSW3_9GLOM|nr:543_t:CDS:1 [Paraglomus occultum]